MNYLSLNLPASSVGLTEDVAGVAGATGVSGSIGRIAVSIFFPLLMAVATRGAFFSILMALTGGSITVSSRFSDSSLSLQDQKNKIR